MPDVTVTCGCTRKMRLDPLRGKGAFICGCGTRVQVAADATPQCTAALPDLRRCPVVPVAQAVKDGQSLCLEHYNCFLELKDLVAQAPGAREAVDLAYRIDRNSGSPIRPMTPAELAERERQIAAKAVVYYIRIGSLIKIGTSANMIQRMMDLGPEEILATEPGSYRLERARHGQFAHLRVHGEWFRAEPELRDHAALIRSQFGEPVTDTNGAGPDFVFLRHDEPGSPA